MSPSTSDCFAEREIARVSSETLARVAPRPWAGPSRPLGDLCREALGAPVGSPSIAELAEGAARIAIIISDASRDEPRREMLDALLEVVPPERVTLVVASGTHPATDEVIPPVYRHLPAVVSDSTRLDRMVDLGVTTERTPVRVLREVAEADLVVVTGRIRPHYFAGYSGGLKGLFPGCGYKDDILKNHLLKADPSSRLGRVEGNRCRADLEQAALRIRGRVAILNVLADCDGTPVAAVSGHPVEAHRQLAGRARELFVVEAPRSPVVVVADRPPVSRSLYQASKCLPPAGAILGDGGVVIVVAECDQGIEPRERVNEGIYRLGVSRQLPQRHRVVLVSSLDAGVVRDSYAEYAPSLVEALDEAVHGTGASGPIPLVWRAGEAIVEPL